MQVPARSLTAYCVAAFLALLFSPSIQAQTAHGEITGEVTDQTGAPAAKVTITLLDCSESPPAAADASLFTPYQTPISIDLNQFVQAGSIRPGSPTGAGLNGASSGVYTPPAGMNGTETVTYVVENGCHQSVQGHLAIDVNRSPVAGSITRELPRGAPPLVLNVTDLASDDEPLSIVSLTGNPAWVTLEPGSSGSPGSFDNATIRADPPAGTASGTYTMNATVQDPGGLTAIATINLIIRNIAPTAVADAYSTNQGLFTFDPTQNDTDPEGGQLCVQTVAITSGAGSTIVSPDPNNPPPGCNSSIQVSLAHGQTTLSYTIRDDGGLTDSSTISILFNHAPTVPDASGATNGQPSFHIELQASEPDGDPLSLTCNTGAGANPDFSVDVRAEPNSGQDPFTQPRFDLTVTVLHPFTPPETFPCVGTDSFGANSNVATITVDIIDVG